MSLLPDLTSRVALVTGGSRGIGRAIALALADAGANVAVNYRERADNARAVAEAIRAAGRRAIAVGADVSDSAAVARMMNQIATDLGPVDVLINNAGIAPIRTVDELTEADFDRTITLNLKSAFLCTQAVLAHLRAQRWGRIVNISSGAARAASACTTMHRKPAWRASPAGMPRAWSARASPLTRSPPR